MSWEINLYGVTFEKNKKIKKLLSEYDRKTLYSLLKNREELALKSAGYIRYDERDIAVI